MSLLECNVTIDNIQGDLIYSKPYNKLFISKRKGGGILIRSLEYLEEANQHAYDSSMFFFDEVEAEILFEWLSQHINKDEVRRICETLDK